MDPALLTPPLLVMAYSQGCFPMPNATFDQIDWYQPTLRAVIPLDAFHVSRSLRRTLNKKNFDIRTDTCFEAVMRACADRTETWITEDFIRVYGELHRLGYAHSVEVWRGEELAGGVYGVALRGAFFAESMFHRATDMSKVALFFLVQLLKEKGFTLLECQFLTDHLASLGALEIDHDVYMSQLERALDLKDVFF
jgi:leucyl/phenylalanyl-tRNA--protein transferase